MKKQIDINTWNRKEHFLFFSQFDEPFLGVTLKVDCTTAYLKAKEKGISFFLYYLYSALKASNQIENFRYRIIENQVFEFDKVNASPTIDRANGTFGFAYMDYFEDEDKFYENALQEIKNVRNSTGLLPAISGENVIHFSAIPWLDFTSISHARNFSRPDSCPKISFGKMTENSGKREMAISIHGHHGLMDGVHVGEFVERFQNLLNAK
ncbi:MAG: chloramphenicol acetyltransferase [Chitinophagales bacterium]|nr:chloramphenicol acetyltransferase [Chitinophagales bacterium]MCZ2394208.1 chloramphenicol acetyltransferase [Chitinophagales bacterium]